MPLIFFLILSSPTWTEAFSESFVSIDRKVSCQMATSNVRETVEKTACKKHRFVWIKEQDGCECTPSGKYMQCSHSVVVTCE